MIPEVTREFDTAWDEEKNGGQLKRGAPAGVEPTDAPTIGSHGVAMRDDTAILPSGSPRLSWRSDHQECRS